MDPLHQDGAILDVEWQQDWQLGQRLERAWPAFFSRFGRLTPVQRAVMSGILDGESTLVCAPTAAGKTEAACAPLMERYCRQSTRWTVLYISPTRALVNDLYERLRAPVESMGLRICRRTGDYHDDLNDLPNVLLTTPESFDSLLCRGRDEGCGHVLAHVVAVVLDEIHLLHGSARGEQVRWLLERLRRLRRYGQEQGWCRSVDFQVVGLSATIPGPEDVVNAYFPPGANLVQLQGGREIELVGDRIFTEPIDRVIRSYVARVTAEEKILVFANSRKRVDELAHHLGPLLEPFGYSVKGHHGSLSQIERENAERAVKAERRIVLTATSTLEIGVDIGDIDLVVLDGPAPDVPAFLQRIGRGNRRTAKTRVMLCAGNRGEEVIQAAMLDAARSSYLGPAERGPQYGVARQQLASYIFQGPHRQRSEELLTDLVGACLPSGVAHGLVSHLWTSEDLRKDASGIRLGDGWLESTGRGDIHSNIEGQTGLTVSDHTTGDAIATNIQYKGGKKMSIAGNRLQVTGVTDRQIEVRRTNTGGHQDAKWSYATSAWVKGASQPQAVRRFLGFGENEWPQVSTAEGMVVFHFGGARRKACLELLARRAGVEDAVKFSDYFIRIPTFDGAKPGWLQNAGVATLELLIGQHLQRLERVLARPAANRHLPIDMRLAEVSEWLNVPRQLEAIAASMWMVMDADPRRYDLTALAGGTE